jgi:hypothetical protein
LTFIKEIHMTAELPRAVICDIDGTLAIRSGDRSPYDWDRVGEDTPNPPVIELVQIIANAMGHEIILMSGRDESCRLQTEMWLDAQQVPFHQLHMRPEKDNRKDSLVKEELYRRHVEGRYAVSWVVDDRDQVVKMWRSLGLTVLQCAEGDF